MTPLAAERLRLKPSARIVLALLHLNPSGLTALECLRDGGGMRLSGRILELRQAGYPIDTEWETAGSARFARYVLREKPEQLHFGGLTA